MRNYFTFGDYDSRDFGVFITRDGVYNAPRRVYRQIQVPGRNGDLMLDEGCFENIDVTYPCLIYAGFNANIEGLRNALLSQKGYVRITDSYHPDEYRLGCFSDEFSVVPKVLGDGGTFEVTFNCKPQRFLLSGEEAISLTNSRTIENPTLLASKPLIRVTGTGTVGISGNAITIAAGYTYIDIDSEIQDCYCGTQNANSLVTFSNRKFPELQPGSNGISLGTGVTSVQITPRWFRL